MWFILADTQINLTGFLIVHWFPANNVFYHFGESWNKTTTTGDYFLWGLYSWSCNCEHYEPHFEPKMAIFSWICLFLITDHACWRSSMRRIQNSSFLSLDIFNLIRDVFKIREEPWFLNVHFLTYRFNFLKFLWTAYKPVHKNVNFWNLCEPISTGSNILNFKWK